MAYFHIDEDVDLDIKVYLILERHEAVTVDDLQLRGARDHTHLLLAAQNQRILVTHNFKDFRLLNGAWREWSNIWGTPHPAAGEFPRNGVAHGGRCFATLLAERLSMAAGAH